MQIKKPLGVEYGFKSNYLSINEQLSKLQDFYQSRRKNQKLIFPPLGNDFLPSSRNIILKGRPIIYPSKQKVICDYNTRYLM